MVKSSRKLTPHRAIALRFQAVTLSRYSLPIHPDKLGCYSHQHFSGLGRKLLTLQVDKLAAIALHRGDIFS
ncbi:MAG: hypothetical protein AB1797_12965 [bacterium]